MGGLTLPFQGAGVVPATADESASAFSVINPIGGIAVMGLSLQQPDPIGPSVGVLGVSGDLPILPGVAFISYGVHGKSVIGDGVHGESQSGSGVAGISQNGVGVFGQGRLAAEFAGDVTITGKLNHNGDCAVSGNISAANLSVAGDVHVTGDVFLTNADMAEEFGTSGIDCASPGTVMALDDEGMVRPSDCAYDKRVAGVVSGAGACKPAIVMDKAQRYGASTPIALVGKVYCKADAQYGPIKIGDLLTTSPTPGHAMKAEDASQAFGSVIGKALSALSTGQGLVPILIALQ